MEADTYVMENEFGPRRLGCETDRLQAYKSSVPALQHYPEKNLMQHIEAFSGRIMSRGSRLVRKTRSFSKLKKYGDSEPS